ncbi:Uncharacterized conserved protein YafD, endonuclease/exonuclease/phosphatase (EEP) superfamily [Cognatiyoonia koreensis]|uniref:Uncharacterized conserved protein YafD, endonuclease/exonuclease/phosphatase (EEP) superfamily n=1 Tax=Cognatiyoonia koreensis TaxID=364200 RepID=A0A1I0N9H3_9RHOB|nr:endonuclease/exonuclease/phosphatase family protein [Cognatiyoonia koreensis]SEV97861.1 Uncharacterized conserved protein YafD, endonuclease/exonuclease/phosphatase (EEP) superfamily [Cognatiyoonia koreensis]
MSKFLPRVLFWVLTGLVVATTLLPLSGNQEWWIRGWDFPRLHIALVALATAALGLLFCSRSIVFGIALLAAAFAYQSLRIFPYTMWATQEIAITDNAPEEEQISIISVNVLMQNTDYSSVIEMVEREVPDVLFLMETDETWVEALKPVLARFETVITYPLENHYGVVFATNLPVVDADVVFLSDDETPSILADLEGPTGNFFFVGLHPRPPVPGQDTDERDEQIKRAALLADREVLPVVAMGDFNDVAWSRTSERFKEYGEFRDPRVGRGMIPSFDATSWWMRFPIDQLYLTEGLDLISFSRLDPVGSDHFPMKAIIAVQDDTKFE